MAFSQEAGVCVSIGAAPRSESGRPNAASINGWCLGSEEFRRELLATAAGRAGQSHFRPNRREGLRKKPNALLPRN
jgi:hypothetical protein